MSSLLEEKSSKTEYQKFMDQNEGDNFNKNINLEKLCTSKYFWAEPYLLKILPYLLDNISNYKMAETSDNSCHLILSALSKESVHLVFDIIYSSFDSMKWQTKCGGLMLLSTLANLHGDMVKQNLYHIILQLINVACDIKKEVKNKTRETFEKLCSTIDNVDIIKIIPDVIKAYMEPVKFTENALDKLVQPLL